VPVGELKKIIESSAGKLLENVCIFDVYEGEQIPKDKKSVALNVSLRSNEATLTEEQVNSVIKKIIKAFEKVNISLRA
jgi:phenylalanyl-tRNA synthetase beta chain